MDKYCGWCKTLLVKKTGEQNKTFRERKFCNPSCSSSFNNAQRPMKHGHGRRGHESDIWWIWKGMIKRCTNSNHKSWKYYGGLGIRVCERWREFTNFLADMGERPDGTSLDRINPNGNYEPSNCRWATPREQRVNQRDFIPTSQYAGVTKLARGPKAKQWQAQVREGGTKVYLGVFATELEAAQAVERAGHRGGPR